MALASSAPQCPGLLDPNPPIPPPDRLSGACGHYSCLGPVHVISWSPAGGSSAQAPSQGRELIISHPAGVLGSEDSWWWLSILPPSDPACRPPGILIQATSLQGPNLPCGWPASAGSAWETCTPQAVLRSGRLLGRAACRWKPPLPLAPFRDSELCLFRFAQACGSTTRPWRAQGLPSARRSPHPTGSHRHLCFPSQERSSTLHSLALGTCSFF